MLTTQHINALVTRDTRVVADALIGAQVLGTEVGDRVLAAIGNYPERQFALAAELERRGYLAEFASVQLSLIAA